MFVTLVYAHVKPEYIDAFRQATLENARSSIQEPGIVRFDVIQQAEDPSRFILVEVYRDRDAPAAHKETSHYQQWRAAVADWMAEDRVGVRYNVLFPEADQWEYPDNDEV